MTGYEEKITISDWYLTVLNPPRERDIVVTFWAELHNGLGIPILNSSSMTSIVFSADPNWPNDRNNGSMRVELSDQFYELLGKVLEDIDDQPPTSGFPLLDDILPEKFSELERWVIGHVANRYSIDYLSYEMQLLCEKARRENSQRDLYEFTEGVA